MTLNDFIALMTRKPWMRGQGAGLLSRRYDISPEDVRKAKAMFDQTDPKSYSEHRLPKILIFDTETAPMRAYV